MSLSYPLTLPSVLGFSEMEFIPRAVVGLAKSPFTLSQEVQAHQGQGWEGLFKLPEDMDPDLADQWIGVLLGLNGREGTFYAGPLLRPTPRGTWAGSPKVKGSHSIRATSIAMDGFSVGATIQAGDWFQQGTGSSSHLHKLVQAATANGSGELTMEVWPFMRAALADNDTFVTSNPKGVWRLQENFRWTERDVRTGGLVLACEEVL